MQARFVPDTVLAAAMSACVIEPKRLNSERIAARFGSYGIDIIDAGGGIRRASLYSGRGAEKVCRTFAVVRIDAVPDGLVEDEHELVMRGGSIGAIFKAHGWDVYKETAYTGSLEVPAPSNRIRELMRIDAGVQLAMHVYRLLLNRGGNTFRYATVVEVHHPDYLVLADIDSIYVVGAPTALSKDEFDELSALVLREA